MDAEPALPADFSNRNKFSMGRSRATPVLTARLARTCRSRQRAWASYLVSQTIVENQKPAWKGRQAFIFVRPVTQRLAGQLVALGTDIPRRQTAGVPELTPADSDASTRRWP